MSQESNQNRDDATNHTFEIYGRSKPFCLRGMDGQEGCTATIVDNDIQLEQFSPSGGGNMSIEIIYSIKPQQIDTVASYFGYREGLTIEQLLIQIDEDRRGLELWTACRDMKIPEIERFTWIS